MRLFIGDDWAEDHHDVELMDEKGTRLAKARLPEGVGGIAKLHAMVAEQLGERAEDDDVEVVVGIETDRGGVGDGVAGCRIHRFGGEPAGCGPLSGSPGGVGG